jgi:hypothetical protein
MDGNNRNNEMVVCCFCGLQLNIRDSVTLVVYPRHNDNESQSLYCHKECINKLLHPSIPRHPDLLDD